MTDLPGAECHPMMQIYRKPPQSLPSESAFFRLPGALLMILDEDWIVQMMSESWREVLGVETELLNQEWQVFLQTRRSRFDTQLFRYGWIGDYNDPYTFAEILESKHGLNDMGYSNPRYDALLAEVDHAAA